MKDTDYYAVFACPNGDPNGLQPPNYIPVDAYWGEKAIRFFKLQAVQIIFIQIIYGEQHLYRRSVKI